MHVLSWMNREGLVGIWEGNKCEMRCIVWSFCMLTVNASPFLDEELVNFTCLEIVRWDFSYKLWLFCMFTMNTSLQGDDRPGNSRCLCDC